MMFNVENTGWKDKFYPLFLGEDPAVHDSVNVTYPEIDALFKKQVSQRWMFDEFNHDQARLDLTECPASVRDIMLRNLAFQWSLDSVASRSLAVLLAPFVSNSELWAAIVEITNMEVVHALTYSEIIRQCVPDTTEVFEMITENEAVISRMGTVIEALEELQRVGALLTIGALDKDEPEVYQVLFKGIVAILILERLQFMTSFPATFANVELGYFQSPGKAVQKIMLDELDVHAELWKAVIRIELGTERGGKTFEIVKDEILKMISEGLQKEYGWSAHMFSEGRSVVGLTESLLNDNARYNAQDIYDTMGLEFEWPRILKNPLPWMGNWIDIDKTQNANQEADNNNYALNMVVNDLSNDILDY